MPKLLLAIALLIIPALSWAQSDQGSSETHTIDEVLWTLGSARSFYEAALSRDGGSIAWVESQSRDGRRGTSIFVASVNQPSQARRISAAGGDLAYEDQVVWSPDAKQVAFLSDTAKSGQQQLYIADIDSGKSRKLTNLTGFVSRPAWSPDGKSIAFLFIENSTRAAGPLQPMTPPSGVIEEKIEEQRINVVDLARDQIRASSPADMYIYEYDWKPDGSGFVATAAHGDGDSNWWVAELYAISLAEGHAQSLYTPKLQIANPRVSPDGRWVAFIQGLIERPRRDRW